MSRASWLLDRGWQPKPPLANGILLFRKTSQLSPGCVMWKALTPDGDGTLGQWVSHGGQHGHAFVIADPHDPYTATLYNETLAPGPHDAWLRCLERLAPARKQSKSLPGGAL